MGKQAKLKAQRREIRKQRKEEAADKLKKYAVNPPDLGIHVTEVVKAEDVFGRK